MAIALEAKPRCILCGEGGTLAYQDLPDALFGVPGRFCFRRCPNDGLYWLDPRPREEELHKAYAKYFTHRDADEAPRAERETWLAVTVEAGGFGYERRGVGAARRAIGRVLAAAPPVRDRFGARLMWLPADRPGRLLDVGCGDGAFLARMRDAGWRVLGVEPDPDAAREAERRGVPVVVGTLADVDADDRFDAITMSHALEHVPDPVAALRQCWRRLAPRGRLVLLTPNAESLGHRAFGASWPGLDPPRHLHVFTRATLLACARAAGVAAAHVRTTARMALIMSDMRLAARRGAPARGARIGGLALLLAETTLGGRYGEELVLTATKPGARSEDAA